MTYGNGLMHVANAGRSYLHHTGGMVSFSSSFHVDIASGVGAFASSTISAFAEYRPRLLTRFAVDALTNALAGRPLPPPPSLDMPLPMRRPMSAHYSGPTGGFEVRAGAPLTLVADGQSAALQPWGGEMFRTHPSRFRQFSLKFEREAATRSAARAGVRRAIVRGGAAGCCRLRPGARANSPAATSTTARGSASPSVVERGGKLWIGTETPMIRLGDNLWRIGEESWSPERASFANFIDGRPQTFIFSGEKFLRHDI